MTKSQLQEEQTWLQELLPKLRDDYPEANLDPRCCLVSLTDVKTLRETVRENGRELLEFPNDTIPELVHRARRNLDEWRKANPHKWFLPWSEAVKLSNQRFSSKEPKLVFP